MQQVITDLLAKRRDRAIAKLLGLKEREVDQHIPPEVRSRLRKAILDEINDFHDLTLDMMRSLDNGEVLINELYLEKIDQIHTAVTRNGRGH